MEAMHKNAAVLESQTRTSCTICPWQSHSTAKWKQLRSSTTNSHHEAAVIRTDRRFKLLMISSLVTVFTFSCLLALSVLYLYTQYHNLSQEVVSSKQLMSAMGLLQEGHVQPTAVTASYAESEEEILQRSKRADSSGSRNNRRRHQRKRTNLANDDDSPSRDVVHIVINERHEDLLDGINPSLKTKSRGDPIPFWKFSDNHFNQDQSFAKLNEQTGIVTISKTGLYFVYSQMTYFDRSGRWSHMISIDNRPFIKCLASEWGIEVDPKTGAHYNTIHQCYTAGVTYITQGDQVALVGMYPDRVIHPDAEMSFWGIIRLD